MTDMINIEHKLTATEVNEKCPIVLEDFAKCIAAHLDKARKYKDKADQNYRSASQYLAEAKDACDDGGFTASEDGKVETPSIVPEQTPVSAKPATSAKSTPGVKDTALADFDGLATRLVQMTDKAKPNRFIHTPIKPDALAKLGVFFTDLANLKKRGASRPTSTVALHGNRTVSADQSTEDRKAWYEAREASGEESGAEPVAAKSSMHSLNTGEI